ncbi:MAG: hypothetical protein HYT70_03905 [Candidatus Aenigmarchaeota archaeon]|nr:hypothetical protein [Candidatus Aenigmarchaeota archaeon]
MRKGQTALEYLMTYGWAILIVIIVIGALYALGLTKTCRWTGTQVTGFTGGGFQAATPKVDASDASLVFDLNRIGASTVTYNNSTATISGSSQSGTLTGGSATIANGDTRVLTFSGFTGLVSGDCYAIDVSISYTEDGRVFTSAGRISGAIEA